MTEKRTARSRSAGVVPSLTRMKPAEIAFLPIWERYREAFHSWSDAGHYDGPRLVPGILGRFGAITSAQAMITIGCGDPKLGSSRVHGSTDLGQQSS
jgi:hypothetical protein